MASVLPPTPKSNKAFYATLYDASGVLVTVNGQITFLRYEDGAVIDFEPEMAPWTCILGEAGLADCQQVLDRLHGGYAAVACGRAN